MELKLLLICVVAVFVFASVDASPRNKLNRYRKERFVKNVKQVEKPKGFPLTTASPFNNVTCTKIVGYYIGIFTNDYDGPSQNISVEFQASSWIDNNKIYASIDQWNDDKLDRSKVQFWIWSNEGSKGCNAFDSPGCFINQVQDESDFWLQLQINQDSNQYDFYYQPDFFNTFELYNAIGKCTDLQPAEWDGDAPYKENYDYCVCCGNKYKPDAALNCPVNPWA